MTTVERSFARPATKAAFSEIRKVATRDDLLLVVLFGHGTFDGETAKFNLVGPDLTAGEWNQLLTGIPARLVLVNTTEASFPFIDALKAKGRVIITATNSAAQKYATVFPEYFVKALSEQIPYYSQRHFVRPGITGWAQINHKYGDTIEDTITKLEYDLYYIKNMSPGLDTYIIFHTVKAMLLSRGAQ